MYASSSTTTHVQQSHHPSLPNGHAAPAPAPAQQPNGHHAHTHHHPMPGPSHRPAPALTTKEPNRVMGIPSVTVNGAQLIHGDADSSQYFQAISFPALLPSHCLSSFSLPGSERSYTPIKVVGDGSFGTVWLADWHSALPPNTPLSPMQCGAGARPEWAGKRLVALKRMKKRWEGGWDECRKLKELEVRWHSFLLEPCLTMNLRCRRPVVARNTFSP